MSGTHFRAPLRLWQIIGNVALNGLVCVVRGLNSTPQLFADVAERRPFARFRHSVPETDQGYLPSSQAMLLIPWFSGDDEDSCP